MEKLGHFVDRRERAFVDERLAKSTADDVFSWGVRLEFWVSTVVDKRIALRGTSSVGRFSVLRDV